MLAYLQQPGVLAEMRNPAHGYALTLGEWGKPSVMKKHYDLAADRRAVFAWSAQPFDG